MADRLVARFYKAGAEFASAEQAQQDRKQFFSEDLKTQLGLVYQDLKNSGLIISGPFLTWDQPTQILTIERVVRDHEEYKNYFIDNRISTRDQIESASQQAGWTRVSFDVIPVNL
jgi:hypothetical protein